MVLISPFTDTLDEEKKNKFTDCPVKVIKRGTIRIYPYCMRWCNFPNQKQPQSRNSRLKVVYWKSSGFVLFFVGYKNIYFLKFGVRAFIKKKISGFFYVYWKEK